MPIGAQVTGQVKMLRTKQKASRKSWTNEGSCSIVPIMRLQTEPAASAVVELASGIDALYVSSKNVAPSALFAELAALKVIASVSDSSSVVAVMAGETFHVGGYGWGIYPVFLDHEFGRIGFSLSQHVPGVRLQIRAQYLHAVGPMSALTWFSDLLLRLNVHAAWSLSRVDLFTDVQGWTLCPGDRQRFLCRSLSLSMYEAGGRFSGFSFGSRKSGTITARIYDKTAELGAKNLSYVGALWGDRYNPDFVVWRIEFEMKTKFLREVGIIQAEDGLARANELWAYATDEWLTFRELAEDENKSRWPVASEWLTIQRASLRGDALSVERVREDESVASLKRLIPGLKGYVSAVGARLGAVDLPSAIHAAFDVLSADEERTGLSMAGLLTAKRQRLWT